MRKKVRLRKKMLLAMKLRNRDQQSQQETWKRPVITEYGGKDRNGGGGG